MLNSEQKLAVENNNGPLLIVAGAGTGKTTVISEKIKFLIEKGLAKPDEILALTFTEKAAREMEERVDVALPYGTFGMWIMTFHSFCDRLLREEGLHIGINPNYKLMTQAESYLFVKNNFWKFNLSYFRPHGNPYKFIAGLLDHFSRLKDEDVSPNEYSEFTNSVIASEAKQSSEDTEKIAASPLAPRNDILELAEAFKLYEDLKIKEGVMDFSDLISYTLKLLRDRPKILTQYQRKFKYILLDEFQDTNYAQYQMVKLLCQDDCNVTVVADDDQSVYRFRGAAISNVLQFRKDYPKAKVIALNKNYRSTQEILDRSYDLIQHNNPDRLEVAEKIDKKLLSQVSGNGEKIEFNYFDRGENEAEYVVKKIAELRTSDSGLDYKDFAILVRANNHSEVFIRAFERSGVPYQFLGPGQLYRQPEIKDLIAYLRFLADFTDTVSLYRVLSMEVFDFKQRDLISLLSQAKKQYISLFEIMEKEDRDFVKMVHKHQELIHKESAGQILYYFLEDSGLLRLITEYKTKFGELQAQNIIKFFDKLKSLEGRGNVANLFSAVEYLELAMEAGESPVTAETDWLKSNAVNILTLHSAKGLEFPVVFLVNLVDGRFPSRERKEQIPIPDNLIKEILPTGDFHIQEERRLCYVGMTRAKRRLFFTAAGFYGEGKRERKISPFVAEAIGVTTDNRIQTTEKEKQISLFEWDRIETAVDSSQKSVVKIDYLSYSAIETFRMCPLHFKLKNILRIPTPPSSAQSMGNSTHLILRDLYLHKDLSLDDLFAKDWISEGYKSKKHEEEAKERVRHFLQDYLKTDLHKNAQPIFLEQPFIFKLTEDLRLGGKFDRIDDLGGERIEIIDYKTGAHVPTKKDIDADLQMTIYSIAAINPGVYNKKISDVKLSFYYFETGEKISTVRTVERLEAAKKEILEIRDQIQKSDFQCSNSILCQSCEFKILCN
ncbi:hypothetical protein A2872_02590 [Candidatus Gottesmanbacteria bacterium RIFCSPHIGHO2_01_FULL_42_12]|uniref:DNA 3'-5' helicase n=1 Tax=Candidatus Gottesmanbacteria bacterium RIFCSPHIGHO2_01_FULL_42_12 TaxID=1798377 RepID=A0A1F5Z0K7_9BACT|nr:MAG: hypothetical protein A2872_02590 [Candidatus Gottesmanbacteria bacterium RIFCSPHIGHO2_01_FULL_42_12]